MAQSGVADVPAEAGEPLRRLLASLRGGTLHFERSGDEGPHEPRPDRALVIATGAAGCVACAAPAVLRVVWRQAAQAVWGEQIAFDRGNDALSACIRKHGVGKTDRENLIGAHRTVALSAVNDIVETASRLMPEHPIKTRMGMGGHRTVPLLMSRITKRLREVFHDAQGVVPQGLDFNGLAVSRRYHPIAHPGIHPR